MKVKEFARGVIDATSGMFVLACLFAMVAMIGVVLPVIAARYLWNLVE